MKTRVTLYLLIMTVLVLGMLFGAAATMAQEPAEADSQAQEAPAEVVLLHVVQGVRGFFPTT